MWRRRRSIDLVDTEVMDAFFDRLDRLNEVGLLNMRAAWNATSHTDHEDAWTAVRAAGALYGLTDEIDRVRTKALAWSARGSNMAPEVRIGQVQNWSVIKMEAGEAIVDAALAVALGDRIDVRHHDLLIGPWLSATSATD